MFVRFRTTARKLQVSLIATRRSAGNVRQEHIASLGTVPLAPSPFERLAFWTRLHERLVQLANRLDAEAQGTIFAAVHARIPIPTQDEHHAEQLDRARADARFWEGLHGLHTDRIEGGRELQETGKRMVAESEAEAGMVAEKLAASRAWLARVRTGERLGVGQDQAAPPSAGRQYRRGDIENANRGVRRDSSRGNASCGASSLFDHMCLWR